MTASGPARPDTGDGGQATAATLVEPDWGGLDAAGDLFIEDNYDNVIREVNAATHIITTVAGNGTSGFSGDWGPATSASLGNISGMAVDAAGDIFIADFSNNVVREVSAATHIIATVAGSGVSGFSGDGGPAAAATFNGPDGLTVDAAGDLFIADAGNGRVREVSANQGVSVAAPVTIPSPAPTSSVAPLAPRTSATSIPVSWSGVAGSGGPITTYNISVSIDGAPFTPWLTNTSLTAATYAGSVGHTYAFISQAQDAAGDSEPAHATADTVTSVVATPWHNSGNPLDVIGKGGPIVPLDAMLVIAYLQGNPGDLPASAPTGSNYVDVLGDNQVVPLDALKIIAYLQNPAANTVTPAASASLAATKSDSPTIATASPAASASIQTDLPPTTAVAIPLSASLAQTSVPVATLTANLLSASPQIAPSSIGTTDATSGLPTVAGWPQAIQRRSAARGQRRGDEWRLANSSRGDGACRPADRLAVRRVRAASRSTHSICRSSSTMALMLAGRH